MAADGAPHRAPAATFRARTSDGAVSRQDPEKITMKKVPESSKKVFKGQIFDVYQWEQKMYDGSNEIFEKVVRPDTVLVIPVTKEGKIIVCEQSQPHRDKPYLSLISGRVEENEPPEEAAKRELLEETGFKPEELILWDQYSAGTKIGWTIYSGEQILNILALNLSGFKPKLIIEVGQTEGVLDTNSKTIPKITPGNFKSIEKMLSETTTADVTGGMKHKVQEALTLAQKGIPTLLISSKPGNPKNAILGKKTQGTWIIK